MARAAAGGGGSSQTPLGTDGRGLPSVAVGIDFGTSRCCVGRWADGRVAIVPGPAGERTIPSCLSFSPEGILTGERARRAATRNPEGSLLAIKRLLGGEFNDTAVSRERPLWPFRTADVGDGRLCVELTWNGRERRLLPETTSGLLISSLIKQAEAEAGCRIDDVVVTVPAHCTDQERQATVDAFGLAGVRVARTVPEPTAAAMAFGIHNRARLTQGEHLTVVYDLGGGTFDVSVLVLEDAIFEVRATTGSHWLGGEDFDTTFMQWCAQRFETTEEVTLSALPRQRLRQACVAAKHALTSASSTTIDVPDILPGYDFTLTVSREEFEGLISDRVDQTILLTRRALRAAKVRPEDVEDVVLVGGSSRIPLVQRRLSECFGGKELCQAINPDEAVATGATVLAAILAGERGSALDDVLLLDALPFGFGVRAANGDVETIIPQHTTIPCKKGLYATLGRDDGHCQVQVVQTDPADPKWERIVGSLSIPIPDSLLERARAAALKTHRDAVAHDQREQQAGNRIGCSSYWDPTVSEARLPVEVVLDVDANHQMTASARLPGLDAETAVTSPLRLSGCMGPADRAAAQSQLQRLLQEDADTRACVSARASLEDLLYETQDRVEASTEGGEALERVAAVARELEDWLGRTQLHEAEPAVYASRRQALQAAVDQWS